MKVLYKCICVVKLEPVCAVYGCHYVAIYVCHSVCVCVCVSVCLLSVLSRVYADKSKYFLVTVADQDLLTCNGLQPNKYLQIQGCLVKDQSLRKSESNTPCFQIIHLRPCALHGNNKLS